MLSLHYISVIKIKRMGKKTTTPKLTKKLTKKQAREIVFNKLAGALDEYKEEIKEKKFKANLKKASKLFAADIAKAENRKEAVKERKKKEPKLKSVQVADQPMAVEQEAPVK